MLSEAERKERRRAAARRYAASPKGKAYRTSPKAIAYRRAYSRRYYIEHTEQCREASRRYHAEHPEVARRHYAKHPEKYKEYARRYYAEHREEFAERLRRHRAEHPEQYRTPQLAHEGCARRLAKLVEWRMSRRDRHYHLFDSNGMIILDARGSFKFTLSRAWRVLNLRYRNLHSTREAFIAAPC